uniref:Dynein heavy chain 1, axonemal n=2 Tax=Photinus pyralis TaxID=7054 RepID=A0A1Y1N5M7_PHOPY
MQHEIEPRHLPRNVAIERKRRQYQLQSIRECLENLRVQPKQIVPSHVVQALTVEEKFGLYTTVNYLPLELFDDQEFDSRSPESWLNHGVMEGVRHPIPAVAFVPVYMKPLVHPSSPDYLNHVYEWTDVAVTNYTPDDELWHVLTLDGFQRTFAIPRIRLMFKAEDPVVFAHRIKAALELRNQAENSIRYEFYLDCMLLTGTHELDEVCMSYIYKSATRDRASRVQNREIFEKLEFEVRLNHKRALGEIQFRYSAEKQPDVYQFLNLTKREVPRVPITGRVATNMADFKNMREYFRWMSIWVIPETYRGMSIVHKYCMEAAVMSLFTSSYGKHVTLKEFETVQSRTTDNVIVFLKMTWISNISRNIRMCLGDIGKGWFNVNEKHPNIYDTAKLVRFMEVVKYRMQHALRLLVENSTHLFVNLVETPCQCCLHLNSDYVWESNFVDSPFKPQVQPIFGLLLKMDPLCGAFYSTDPRLFPSVLLSLYDSAIKLTHGVNQVHPSLLKHLKFPSDLYLSSVGLLDKDVCDLRERMLKGYEKAIIPLLAYAETYSVHMELYTLDVTTYIGGYLEEQHSAVEYKDTISHHFKMRDNLEVTLPSSIVIGPFFVNTEPLKTFLINKRQEIAGKLLDQFAAIMKGNIEEIIQEYKFFNARLLERATSIENIYEIRDWMETIPMTVKGWEEATKKYLLEYDVLDYFWYSLPQEDFENKWDCIGWPYRLAQQIERAQANLDEEFDKYLKIQMIDESVLQEKIENFTVIVTQLSGQKDFNRVHEIALEIKRLWKAMKEAQEHGQMLNQRQKLFLMPVTPYDTLTKLIKEFEPYRNLWVTASEWLKWHEIWMDNPLVNVDGEAIEGIVSDMYKTMIKSVKLFVEIEAVQSVALEIKKQIESFKPMIPLIQTLRNPGMRQRHWDAFKAETGIVVNWTPTITFNDFIALGIQNYSDVISKIGDNAGKEYAIESVLDKMVREWDHNFMELTLYKTTGTYIMKVADDILQLLDDHIVMTQQLSFSPFKGPFEERIDNWEEKLKTCSECLEEWMEVQRQWMYLEPIFASPDITQQLPTESKKYSTMERTWRRIMKNACDCPSIILTCSDKKLLESLKECNHLLEVVQKGLTNYLEMKRSVFPRLYFLSDDELLEILSQARNPLAVQPHLRKCFENIARLTFEDDLKISQMWSAEDEGIDLRPSLYPTGNVECWLVILEESMKNTVRTTYGDSLETLFVMERKEWVLMWPGQIVIAGCQTYWTNGVEDALSKGDLAAFFDVVLENLDQLRGLVRGSLTYLHREILSALIVIEVHARDVTQNLVDSNVTNVNDFDWISQLRYYWVEQELKVRAVNAEFQYGYEYLGNSGRLVITPLTDRCYLTLTGALHLKFGGAPAGPAGTGKTETTKDLAKAMAIQCVVFNCSDQLDFMAMGKFFKGLASSGAWACFDEFNRIDIEVLSVVAQQIMTIQKAQQAKMDSFIFEGVEIALKQSCAVFITMNPGYAGRTELPDNLKALFRPVSMMVPNYGLIAEISLFSFGFSNAKQLANKITTTFKLSSEQLSSQDHYDFGMRAVKTVIAVAGNLKRENPDMDERQIILRALLAVNVPKFLKDDLKLFYGIVSDLFPKMKEEAVDYGLLEEFIRKMIIKHGLEDVDEYVIKVIQLYETTVVRHGLMLVGPTGSGKTKCYEVLKDAMTVLRGKPTPGGYPFQPVHTYVLNPKSITMGQLYGEFDLQTHEWTDGILPSLVRIGCSATDKDKRWYVFDGPVDAVWIENMNTVLDDNKKLCLSSGEIIKLRDTQTMIFEVADLAVASPATVSRCGMVYLEPGILGLQPYLNCWIRRLPQLAVEFASQFNELFEIYLLPAVELLRSKLREILVSVDSAIVTSFLHLMDFRLGPLAGKDNKPPPAAQFLKLIPDLIVPWFVWCLTWTIGATCDNYGRMAFNNWLRNLMDEHDHGPKFPSEGLVYDYRLHDGGFTDPTDDNEPMPPTWHNWMENAEPCKITNDTKYSGFKSDSKLNFPYSFEQISRCLRSITSETRNSSASS